MDKLQESNAQMAKWHVLLRVLESPIRDAEPRGAGGSDSETSSTILTEYDRDKWRQIITRESILRSLLTQATVREDYERIRRDTRYEKLFEPEKWDVIIRVLASPDIATDDGRFNSDSTSEVSSSGSTTHPQKPRHSMSKRSSDTIIGDRKSMTDVRSMSEVMVDFATNKFEIDDDSSMISSFRGRRSVADRSQTEFVESAPLDEEYSDSILDGKKINHQY
jgi:hypothetical protein